MTDFLETVKRGIEKGVATVGARSKEMLEVSQLRSQIRDVTDERRGKLEELGNIVHTMLARGALDEARLREKSQAIATLDAAIKQREEQIQAIQVRTQEIIGGAGTRQIGQCACGAPLLEGAKFCGGCGSPAAVAPPRAEESSAPAQPACPRGGAEVVAGARFCGGCGGSL
jgi:NADH pyrophosphatase NudC (nudix superfamily)